MKNKKFRFINSILITAGIIFVVLLVSFVVARQRGNEGSEETQQETYTKDEVNTLVKDAELEGEKSVLKRFKEAIEGGTSVINALKELYPEYIVVASSGTYHWVEINESLAMNDYSIENLSVDESTGEYTYLKDGAVISQKGIDVSSHQGDIDWARVKADGVEFAFIRALYRGYGSGEIVIDEKCLENIAEARAAGVKVGVYVFSQAITEEEAIEEASTVLTLLDGIELDLPIVLDVEKLTANGARMNALSVDERTDICLTFLNQIKAAGYTPMLYHNTEMGSLLIDLSQFEDYEKWFAGYNKELYWPYQYKYWQYSESGLVDGISGAVDMDILLEP